jgi:transcriptional regulator
MYIPKINQETDHTEIVNFMKRFSFGTIISNVLGKVTATHLPFLITENEGQVLVKSHFAKANEHWQHIENQEVLVIFTEPHAYISPRHYDNVQNVPTWNYLAVHAYGEAKILYQPQETTAILEATINQYEPNYIHQWQGLSEQYKANMTKGIVAFEIKITELQAKKKLSQNRSDAEKTKIKEALSESSNTTEKLVAEYMKH